MNKVVLFFSDTEKMADFVISEKISHVEVDSKEGTIIGMMSKPQVRSAVEQFDAFVKQSGSTDRNKE
jgi:hypothetical protein